jgi:hypothetical protein
MPRQSLVLAAMFAMFAVMAGARPALAAYGAFAYDEGAHKFGYSHDEATQKAADAAALKGCASPGCKIVFHTGPQQCGAIATGEDGKVWGGAYRDQRPAAELAAMQDCQKRTSGQCKVKASECNH